MHVFNGQDFKWILKNFETILNSKMLLFNSAHLFFIHLLVLDGVETEWLVEFAKCKLFEFY